MIAWETCIVYIIMSRIIKLWESDTQERLKMWFIFTASTETSVNQITPKLFYTRLIKLVNFVDVVICKFILDNFEFKPNIVSYSNFSHIAIC